MKVRRAFTTIELMVVMVVVAIILVISMPDTEGEAREQGKLAAMRFAGDVAYARSGSIARPDDPIVIKIDGNTNSYWLARQSDPDTPIAHPKTGLPYVVTFGANGDIGMDEVEIYALDFDGDTVLTFDAYGGTDQDTSAILQLTSGGATYEVAVAPVNCEVDTYEGFQTQFTNDYPYTKGHGFGGNGVGGP